MKLRRFRKWVLMLSGKGTLHVKKGEGENWSKEEVRGFYIDYSGKLNTKQINEEGLPYTKLENGTTAVLPITVIQYGLGCYEEMLKGKTDQRQGFYRCVDYLMKTQAPEGFWRAFAAQKTTNVMSSMVQGEAAALLLRAYRDSEKQDYLDAAKRACDFMLLDKEQGGTAETVQGHLVLLEGTDCPMILNGAIYSWFGLYDLWKVTGDIRYGAATEDVIAGIKCQLPAYDTGYWSYYCLDKRIASPFYHQLHITQLRVLAKLLDDNDFESEARKYEKYYCNRFCYGRAFVKKAFQKLTEKNDAIAIIE